MTNDPPRDLIEAIDSGPTSISRQVVQEFQSANHRPPTSSHDLALRQAVYAGLSRSQGMRALPPWLLYDAQGSRLFDEITTLDEYYPTRVEQRILNDNADAIVQAVRGGTDLPLHVVELGAGSAEKTTVLFDALARTQDSVRYMPIDVSRAALDHAKARLRAECPFVQVQPVVARYEDALHDIEQLGPRRLVLWIGSSMGNFPDAEAKILLSGVRSALVQGGCLLLGVDRPKSSSILVPAYDDARGVTAAFNLNLLKHLNRELHADFDLSRFAHRAVWNEAASQMEMHLESIVSQRVKIRDLGLQVDFVEGERIHTESSIKYDDDRLASIVQAAGFDIEQSFFDAERWFGVHLCRAV